MAMKRITSQRRECTLGTTIIPDTSESHASLKHVELIFILNCDPTDKASWTITA